MALDTVFFVPSCGTVGPVTSDCPSESVDPGVFVLGEMGIGTAGTACEGIEFEVQVSNANSGRVEFAPPAPVVLDAPNASLSDTCTIAFECGHRGHSDG